MKAASIVLFFCVTALIALGMVMLISASTGLSVTPKYLLLQPIWCILGFVACWVASMGDYRWFKKHSWLVWGLLTVTCGLLVLVLVPGIGHKIKGASRWLKLGSLTLHKNSSLNLNIPSLDKIRVPMSRQCLKDYGFHGSHRFAFRVILSCVYLGLKGPLQAGC